MRLIREVGADKLSMRTLAAHLRVTPMALYYHVPNKEALLDLAVDSVLMTMPMPAPNAARWREQMKAYAVTSWQLVSAYPGLNRVLLTRERGTKGVRRLIGYGLSILLNAGFSPAAAARAITTYHMYLYGAFGAITRGIKPPQRRSRQPLNGGPEAAPLSPLHEAAQYLLTTRIEDSLDSGIEAVLNGIAAELDEKPRKRARS